MYAKKETESNESSTQQDVKTFIPMKVLAGQSVLAYTYVHAKKQNA